MGQPRVNNALAPILVVHVEVAVILVVSRKHGVGIIEESGGVHVHLGWVRIWLRRLGPTLGLVELFILLRKEALLPGILAMALVLPRLHCAELGQALPGTTQRSRKSQIYSIAKGSA